MAFQRTTMGWLVIGLLAACGSSDADISGDSDAGSGGNAGAGTGGSSGSAGSGASSGSSGAAGSAGAAGQECKGTHPLLDGGIRFCSPGECRCQGSDLCFPQEQAARCCEGELRCFTADGGVECPGTHPKVDGSARFCDEGACYCAANDTCFPAGVAPLCCGTGAKCG